MILQVRRMKVAAGDCRDLRLCCRSWCLCLSRSEISYRKTAEGQCQTCFGVHDEKGLRLTFKVIGVWPIQWKVE